MKEALVVYTAIIAGYDRLHAPRVINPDVRYVSFTDAPMPHTPPWEQVLIPRTVGSSIREAKRPKLLAHKWFPETKASLWIDAQVQLAVDPMELYSQLGDHDIAVCGHPRDCVYTEGEECIRVGCAIPALVREQLAAYRDAGYPEHAGLGGTTMVLRRHTSHIARLNEIWFDQLCQYSTRDQVSFPYACWLTETLYGHIPTLTRGQPSWHFMAHARKRDEVEVDQAVARALAIPGWCTETELRLLYRLAMQAPIRLPLVELGTFRGRTAALIGAAACRLRAPVISIDDFAQDQVFKMMAGLPSAIGAEVAMSLRNRGHQVEIVVGDSAEIPTDISEVGMLFVDSEHVAKRTNMELDAWLPLMGEDSILAFHDYVEPRWPDIKQIVHERILREGGWELLDVGDSLIGFKRNSAVGPLNAKDAFAHFPISLAKWPDGTFVVDPDRTIYRVEDGMLRPIRNWPAFQRYDVPLASVKAISRAELDRIWRGKDICE